MKAKFISREKLSNNISSFWFKPTSKISFIPGQFTDITLYPDNHKLTQTFTISSSPEDDLISVTIKFQDKVSQYKNILNNLKPDDLVDVGPVMGDFVLPIDKSISAIFIAGGIGITPLISIVSELKNNNDKREIKIIHAISSTDDLIKPELFIDQDYHPILKNKTNSWLGEFGKVDINLIKKICTKTTEKTIFYVSGPQVMVESLFNQISKAYPNNQRVMDYFPGYLDI
jgi:ferredoxin-NADP reductase